MSTPPHDPWVTVAAANTAPGAHGARAAWTAQIQKRDQQFRLVLFYVRDSIEETRYEWRAESPEKACSLAHEDLAGGYGVGIHQVIRDALYAWQDSQ